MATKRCTKCGKTKDLSEFRPRKDTLDGHRSQCKACMSAMDLAARLRREEVK
jgi:NAD-dependent SIR2 family protein deacetylase